VYILPVCTTALYDGDDHDDDKCVSTACKCPATRSGEVGIGR